MDVSKCYNPHIQSSLTAKIIKYYFFSHTQNIA